MNKEKQYRECEYRGFLHEKIWYFLSEIFSYDLTYGKKILRKRTLTMSELMICSVSN